MTPVTLQPQSATENRRIHRTLLVIYCGIFGSRVKPGRFLFELKLYTSSLRVLDTIIVVLFSYSQFAR